MILITTMGKKKRVNFVSVVSLAFWTLLGTSVGQLQAQEMGAYATMNRLQCHRLCLYRKLCSHFMYTQQERLGDSNNCRLYTAGNPAAEPLSSENVNNACASRPCDVNDMCVPEGKTSHRCLYYPSHCGAPSAVHGASLSATGSTQDHVATVTCLPEFVMRPLNASRTLTCLVTSQWTSFPGKCWQIEWPNGTSIPMSTPFPAPLTDRWSACFKGKFEGYMTINLMPDETKEEIILRGIFRQDQETYTAGIPKTFTWGNRTTISYNKFRMYEAMPLSTNDTFVVHLTYVSNKIRLTLNHNVTYELDLTDPNYFGTTVYVHHIHVIAVLGQCTLHYVHITNGDACL